MNAMDVARFPELVVNGESVPQAVVAGEVQHHGAPKGKPGIAWRKAANAVAVRVLLVQEARKRGLAPQPAKVAPGRVETDDEALIRALLDTVLEVAPPSEAAVRAEWERDPSRFRSPPLWEVSHILSACDPRDKEAYRQAQARAVTLTEQALESPRSFSRLAKENSDCASKSAGGSLGQLGNGDTVSEFEAVLRTLSEGEITSTPVLTRHGWHVIRMDGVANGAILPYSAVRQKISDAMEKTIWARAARALVGELIESADISGADLRPAS